MQYKSALLRASPAGFADRGNGACCGDARPRPRTRAAPRRFGEDHVIGVFHPGPFSGAGAAASGSGGTPRDGPGPGRDVRRVLVRRCRSMPVPFGEAFGQGPGEACKRSVRIGDLAQRLRERLELPDEQAVRRGPRAAEPGTRIAHCLDGEEAAVVPAPVRDAGEGADFDVSVSGLAKVISEPSMST